MPTMKPWSARRLLTFLLLVLAHLGLATAAHAFGATECAGHRFGSNLGCTANDVSINSITVLGSPPSSCVGGATLPLDLSVKINFGSATRYDVGVFLSNNGMDPKLTSATSCSVAVLPTTSPFWGSVASGGDGDSCGDGGDNISGSFTMSGVTVSCTTDGSGNAGLYIPYVISWDQQDSNFCGDNTYPVPGTTSKCNAGSVTFPPGTTIVVLPAVTIGDGVTTVRTGDTLTYTMVITNTTGSTLSGAVLTDPAVAGLNMSSVTCVAAGGATCPASSTVAAMQGAGIALPSMPNNSTLTFTVVGTYTGTPTTPTTLTNTASVTVSGQTNSASDTDTVMVPPIVSKTFSPSTIVSGGTSTLTITLTNLTPTVAITGAGFTDTYPVGMTNTAAAATTDCSGGIASKPNSGSVTLTGATIAAGASCTLTVVVTATTTGTNPAFSVASANAATGSSAATTLSVVSSFNAFETGTAANAIVGPIYTKIAGTAFSLDVVAISGGAQATSFSGDVKLELLANTGTAGSGYGADNCPTAGTVIQTLTSAAIASGRSTVSFAAVAGAYRDVRVRISYPTGASPSIVICSTDNFAIRPPAFTIGSTNAGNNAVSGTPAIKAGASFNLTATAVAGYDGTPIIDATQVVGSPTAGTLAGSFGAADSATGVATGSSFTYSEVGNFGLNANAIYDASFTGVDQSSDCTDDFSTTLASGKYGCKIGSNAIAQTTGVSGFGRFIPDHFAITSPAATPACASGTAFTYFGQDGFTTVFTLTAQNSANATTTNYVGAGDATSRAKLPLTVWGAAPAAAASPGFGFAVSAWAPAQPVGAAIAASATAPTASNASTWVAGTTTVTARHRITRPTNPAVPTTVTVSALPVDADGVTMPAAADLGTSLQRFGILRLDNAYGSELLPIRVTARAMYCNAVSGTNCTQWTTNADDGCTSFTPANGTLANYQAPASVTNPLASTNFRITGTNPNTATGSTGNWTAASVTTSSGIGTIILSKPCVGGPGAACSAAVGSVDLTLDLSVGLPWLQGSWTSVGAWNQNPTARLKFGSPKAPFIYLRERY